MGVSGTISARIKLGVEIASIGLAGVGEGSAAGENV
jgi:hypothetical protein